MNRDPHGSHPDQAALVAWAASGGDPSVAAHLEGCATCRGRVDEWQLVAPVVADALRAAADEPFSDGALAEQRAEIMRRLRGEPRARVIQFPAADKGERPLSRMLRPEVRRWVAAAALFGVVVGGSVVRLLDPRPPRAVATSVARAVSPSAQPSRRPATVEAGAPTRRSWSSSTLRWCRTDPCRCACSTR